MRQNTPFVITLAVLLSTFTLTTGTSWRDAGCKLYVSNVMDCTFARTGGTLTNVPTDLPMTIVHLWLSDNIIENVYEKDLEGLHNLKYLYIDNNKLKWIEEGSFNDLQSLAMVLLSGNSLESLPAGLFLMNSQLKYIDLNSNQLSGISRTTFAGLNHIKHLNLFENQITDIECGSFTHVESAEYFTMGANPSVCSIDKYDAHLRCTCDANTGSDGSQGYCTKSECSLPPPVFNSYATETTITTTTTLTTVTEALLPPKRLNPKTGDSNEDKYNLVQDQTSDGTAHSNDNSSLIGGVTGCIAVVAAAFGVAAYRRSKSRHAFDRSVSPSTDSEAASSVAEWKNPRGDHRVHKDPPTSLTKTDSTTTVTSDDCDSIRVPEDTLQWDSHAEIHESTSQHSHMDDVQDLTGVTST